jgi:hypothetical protein
MSDNKSQLATFRIEPELWEAFKAQARKDGKTASDVLIDFVQSYVRGEASPASSAEARDTDNLESRIDEKVGEAIAPIRAELAELRAALEEQQRGKSRKAA